MTSCTEVQCFTNWANQSTVVSNPKWNLSSNVEPVQNYSNMIEMNMFFVSVDGSKITTKKPITCGLVSCKLKFHSETNDHLHDFQHLWDLSVQLLQKLSVLKKYISVCETLLYHFLTIIGNFHDAQWHTATSSKNASPTFSWSVVSTNCFYNLQRD